MTTLTRILVAFIMVLSLALNLWGNAWGTPSSWHPDEVTAKAVRVIEKRTLHPTHFYYGGLYTYILATGAVAPVSAYSHLFDHRPDKARESEEYQAWRERQLTRVIILARSISAVFATAQVFLTYIIGALAFGPAVGLMAALFLAVAPFFVAIAHFATVDTVANFWYWLTFLFAVLIWRRGGNVWYALGSLAAGIAIGIKADRLLAVLPLLAAHVFRPERLPVRRLFLFSLLILAGYVLANPWLLISPFEFLDGTTRDLFFNMAREEQDDAPQYVSMLVHIAAGLGLPLFTVAMAGMLYALANAIKGRDRAAIGLLFAAVLPFYMLFGSRYFLPWYVPFIFPALALFAAYACIDLFRAIDQRLAGAAAVMAVAAVAGFSLMKAVAFNLTLVNDSRYLAAEWIDRNASSGATIGVGPRGPGPLLPSETYGVIDRPMDMEFFEFTAQWRENLRRHELYTEIRRRILDWEAYFGAEFGTAVRERPYQAWFDGNRESPQAGTAASGPEQWHGQSPDYIVLVDYLEQDRIRALQEASGYRTVARIRYQDPFGYDLEFPFVNPEVFVFKRRK